MGNVLFIDKPKNMTSFDVCYRLRKVLDTKKIGHTGTLDPNATGVMIVLFDKATKANQFLVSDRKEYECEVRFGIETDTLDIDGIVVKTEEYSFPSKDLIESTLKSFLGESIQEVPLTSAISVDGKRLYQYQRENKEVEIPKRKVNIYSIELMDVLSDGFSFKCEVSSGTYIRALVRDICHKMDLLGIITELKRTRVDDISLKDCDPLCEVEKGNYRTHDLFELLSSRYETVEYEPLNDVYNGKRIRLESNAEKVLIRKGNEAIAIYEKDGDVYRSARGLW